MKLLGLFHPSPVFVCGQLFMALSRVGNPNTITIVMKSTTNMLANSTRNTVFKEVLIGCIAGAQQNTTHILQEPLTVHAPQIEDKDEAWPSCLKEIMFT